MIYTFTLHQVYLDEVFKISVEANLSVLQLTWLQHPSSEEYRRGYQQAITYALAVKAQYWLTDSRQVAYLHLADQHWMYEKMHPLLNGNQLFKFALVLQPETLMMTDRQASLDKSEKNRKKLGNLDFFLDMDSAWSWLLEEGQRF